MWLSWLERHPVNCRAAGLIPHQSTCLGCRLSPQSVLLREATNQCVSFTSMFLSLPFPLSKINKQVLG